MKKRILTFALICTTMLAFSQSPGNTITVNGSHEYRMTPEYSSKMLVSLNNVYYDAQTINLSELKSGYYEKLEKAGISQSKLTEDMFAYNLLGYEKEGVVIEFKTNSIDEMKKFLSIKSIGVTRSDTSMEYQFDVEQAATYAEKAFENAKKKAAAIAQKVGKKVGKVISISDSNYHKVQESLYYGNLKSTREYYISATFELQ